MNASVKWKGRLTFTGTADSGFTVPLGSYPEVGGDNDGFRPMELMAISLAGCTAMDVISILQKMRVNPEAFEVATDAVIEDNFPKRILEIVIKYRFKGKDLPVEKIQHAIELSLENYCGVSATLRPTVKLSHQIFINDRLVP